MQQTSTEELPASTQCFVYKNAATRTCECQSRFSADLSELTCPSGYSTNVRGRQLRTSSRPGYPIHLRQVGESWVPAAQLRPSGRTRAGSRATVRVAGIPVRRYEQHSPCSRATRSRPSPVSGDPLGTTKGKSGGGGSCWVATYATSGEAASGNQGHRSDIYHLSHRAMHRVMASYTCSDPKTNFKPPTSATGPYLTVAAAPQSQAPNPNN